MKKVFIETNSYSHLLKKDSAIETVLSQAEKVFISVVTVGELYYGFYKGKRFKLNIVGLDKFLHKSSVTMVIIDQKISKLYGKLKFEIMRKGTPIPENDIWIATQVIATKSTLITYDRHFLKVPNLRIWKELK